MDIFKIGRVLICATRPLSIEVKLKKETVMISFTKNQVEISNLLLSSSNIKCGVASLGKIIIAVKQILSEVNITNRTSNSRGNISFEN